MEILLITPQTGKHSIFNDNKIVNFLYEHLDQYGDAKDAIQKCIDYVFTPNKGGLILLAIENNEIVGATIINNTGMSGYIPENILVYIAVNKNQRGKGVGKQIMQKAIANTDGDIALHVEKDNPAKFLYEKMGFTNPYLEMRLKKMNTDNEIVLLRKELHQHPEISGEEFETKKRIIAFFDQLQPDQVVHLGKTGVAFVFNGKAPGKTVMLRCELDALPIQEINTFDYISKTEGKAHLCGHDGHMSIIAAAGKYYSNNRPEKGRVVLLYQPAEENGEGAKEVLADANFKQIEPDYAISLHNVPGYKKGQIVYKYGNFTPSVTSIIIKLTGKTSHAAEPHKGINPSLAISKITQQTLALARNIEDDEHYTVITPIYTHIGSKAYGTSAGYGETHFTIRTLSNERTKELTDKISVLAEKIAKEEQLNIAISFTEAFEANENNDEIVDIIKQTATENNFDTLEKPSPFPWGEDFGLFTVTYKGAMFGLGSGEDTPRLHNPDYDFPDEIAPIGTAMFINIAQKLLT